MPGITLHFVLAQKGLDRLESSPAGPPFDPTDPVALNAYFHGAIGPDLGYLPGGYRLLSDLAHKERTGALTSALIRSARTPTERAFAWGWLTHVLADRLIHPWIGLGVGELVTGCRDTFVGGTSDPESHLRVELGVDCWYAARNPEARAVRLRPAFDEMTIAFLEHAYQSTYEVFLPKEKYLTSHRTAGRRAGQALASLRVIGALMEDAVWTFSLPGASWVLGRAYRIAALRGISLAYLNPVTPSPWLLAAVERATDTHGELLLEAYRKGGEDIEDYHLDSGRRLTPDPTPAPAEPPMLGVA